MAERFLADGLSGGRRVVFLGPAVRESELDGVDGFAAARAAGAAAVVDLGHYGAGGPVDPSTQARAYAEATEQALADGYTGLRVAADVTSLVGTVEGRAAFARYEHLIDAYVTRQPFSAMCGYDRRALGDAAVAELACMHALARRSSTPLRLFAAEQPGVAAMLAGEVDLAGHALLRTALDRVDLARVGGTITIDARDLSFIDHRGLMQLVEHVRSRGATTELLVGRRSIVSQVADLLRLTDLRVVVS